MAKNASGTALVAGAGVGGLAAAIALRRAGWEPVVLERAGCVDPLGAGITLWPNAVHTLRRLGLAEQVAALPPVQAAGGIRTNSGRLLAATDATAIERRFGAPLLVVHRALLHDLLLGALGPGRVRLGAAVQTFEQDRAGVTAGLTDGSALRAALLVGADGLHSTVRRHLLGDGPPRYAGYTAWRAVTSVDAAPIDIEALPLGELWGPGAVFGLVPIPSAGLYWFATKPAPPGERDTPQVRQADVLARFAGWHPTIGQVVAATPAGSILRHDVFDRNPRRGWSRGRVTLLGDAAHAMTPHLGQGACQALEDATALVDCLSAAGDVPAALAAYEDRRYRRTAPLVRRSRQIGRLAQLHNPALRRLRDTTLRALPREAQLRQLEPVLRVPAGPT